MGGMTDSCVNQIPRGIAADLDCSPSSLPKGKEGDMSAILVIFTQALIYRNHVAVIFFGMVK
jgi:hypothetical protein